MQDSQPFEEQEKVKKGRFQSSFYDWGEALIASLIFIVVLFTFFVRLIGVDGSSMFPTLHDRDVMAVSDPGYTPARGDLVVLNKESFGEATGMKGPIVKRIIATAGDEVDIDFALGRVYVNGEELHEDYINSFELPMLEGDVSFPRRRAACLSWATTATVRRTAGIPVWAWLTSDTSSAMCWLWSGRSKISEGKPHEYSVVSRPYGENPPPDA